MVKIILLGKIKAKTYILIQTTQHIKVKTEFSIFVVSKKHKYKCKHHTLLYFLADPILTIKLFLIFLTWTKSLKIVIECIGTSSE